MSNGLLRLPELQPCAGYLRRHHHPGHVATPLSVASRFHGQHAVRHRPTSRGRSYRCTSLSVCSASTAQSAPEQQSRDQQALVCKSVSNVTAAALKLSLGLLRPLQDMLGALQSRLHQIDWKGVQAAARQCKQTIRKTNIVLAAAPVAAQGSSYTLLLLTRAMAKFVEWYLLLLFVRVLLSWFPTFDWDQQPWLAIRQLTDPYLNLFRNIIPPLLGMMDFTPLLGFIILQNLQGYLAALSARPDEDMW